MKEVKKVKEEFIKKFENELVTIKKKKNFNEIVFLCVGTNKVMGDLVGPLVGSKLNVYFKTYNILNMNIYGTLNENVNYMNIESVIKRINNYHKESCLIVIDSALSNKENIGKIFISNKKTILGKGLDKDKIEVGDISIKAVVAKDLKIPIYNFKNLKNVSIESIVSISNIVARGIFDVIKYA